MGNYWCDLELWPVQNPADSFLQMLVSLHNTQTTSRTPSLTMTLYTKLSSNPYSFLAQISIETHPHLPHTFPSPHYFYFGTLTAPPSVDQSSCWLKTLFVKFLLHIYWSSVAVSRTFLCWYHSFFSHFV